MPTVQEVLKQSGMTDEQITSLDAKVLEGFNTVLTTASQEKERAELALRRQRENYEKEIVPALNSWGAEKANLEAQLSFYRTQNEKAREAGFVPQDAPGFQPPNPNQPRNPQNGRYEVGGNEVPGSPQLVRDLESKVGTAFQILADTQWEYQSLFGSPLPESPSRLAQEAEAQALPLREYVERKYGFAAKREEIARKRQEERDAKIRQEAAAERDRYWTERAGNNPDVRAGVDSDYGTVRKATEEGKRKDPLAMTEQERRQATRAAIRSEVRESQQATA